MFPAPRDYIWVGLHTQIQGSFSLIWEKISEKTLSKFTQWCIPASFCRFQQFKSSPKSNSCTAKCFQAHTQTNGVGECSAPFRSSSFNTHMNKNLCVPHSCIWPKHVFYVLQAKTDPITVQLIWLKHIFYMLKYVVDPIMYSSLNLHWKSFSKRWD